MKRGVYPCQPSAWLPHRLPVRLSPAPLGRSSAPSAVPPSITPDRCRKCAKKQLCKIILCGRINTQFDTRQNNPLTYFAQFPRRPHRLDPSPSPPPPFRRPPCPVPLAVALALQPQPLALPRSRHQLPRCNFFSKFAPLHPLPSEYLSHINSINNHRSHSLALIHLYLFNFFFFLPFTGGEKRKKYIDIFIIIII